MKPARFVWYELMTSDAPAALTFYTRVFVGWSGKDSGLSDRSYTILSMGERAVGGLMAIPDEAAKMGARPGWLGYIGVDDIEECLRRLQAAGGRVLRPAETIPGVGRFAVATDPHGAPFVPFQGEGNQEPQDTSRDVGHVGWHELHADELGEATKFYLAQFGWTLTEAMDMGEMGTYQMFATGGNTVGGMMKRMPGGSPVPFWMFYFNVDDIEAAIARVSAAGGQTLHGPQEVPGGAWIANCADPQGAAFSMVGPKR